MWPYFHIDAMRYLLFCLLIIPSLAFSQQAQTDIFWRLAILNSQTGNAIPGATISINRKHFIVDGNGQLSIDKTYIKLNDTLKISCVGFRSESMIIEKDFTYPGQISLFPSDIVLNEVIVKTAKPLLKLGDLRKTYNSHLRSNPNGMDLQYIPNDKGITGIITTIEYFINNVSRGIERPFKVGLYTKGKHDIFPDQNLLNDSLVICNPEKKKRIIVDVSKYNIQFPADGVLAAFETLCPEAYGNDQYWENGSLYSKVPGIDMNLKKAGSFTGDLGISNRTTPYALVMGATADDRYTSEQLREVAFTYGEDDSFAIVITVEQQQ
jgi:hypothetical protein